MVERLPRGVRIVLVVAIGFLGFAISYAGYRLATKPVTLTVVAGSIDGDATRLLSAIATRLATSQATVRLKVVDKGSTVEAAKAFSAGQADLALARPDIGNWSAARTVMLMTYGVVLILAPASSGIDEIKDLKGKVVGVVGGAVNRRVVEVLDREYELGRGKVVFRDLDIPDVRTALEAKQVHALLLVSPLTEKYVAMIKGLFPAGTKRPLHLVSIDSADAIEHVEKIFESYELPKGAVRGNPPIPDEDLTTLKVPFYLLANTKISDDTVGALTRAVLEARRDLVADFPLLAQIAAPSTDKDAFIPIHPGAKAYFDGDQKTFFDKYGDALFYGSMAVGSLTSLMAAAWKFMGFGGGPRANPLVDLNAVVSRIRQAGSDAELDTIEQDIDATFAAWVDRRDSGEENGDVSALYLWIFRLEQLSLARRAVLRAMVVPSPADPGRSSGSQA